MPSLTETEFGQLKDTINNTIHELVIAFQQASDDNLDDALTCLTVCQSNIDTVAENLAAKAKG